MSQLPNTHFLCPACGEQISKNAKICRFCNARVSLDIWITALSEDTHRAELAKKILESQGKPFFNSFGNVRKALERKKEPFLKNLRKEDAEKIGKILEQHKVLFNTDLHAVAQPQKTNMKPAIVTVATIFFLVTAGLTYQAYQKKNKSVSDIVNEPHSESELTPAFDGNVQKYENPAPSSNGRQREAHPDFEKLLSSTATVLAGDGSGSAFFVSSEGHLISNNHVTKNNKEVEIQTFDGNKFKGKVLRSDSFYDLSLIKIETRSYSPLKLGDATAMRTGDTVWTLGAPHGLAFTVTKGIISFVGRNMGGKAFIQADVAINPGNSGGPMINDQGEVIGINNFIIKQTQGLNFAIPSNYLYMGDDTILKDVIPLQSLNSVMANWKSWEMNEKKITKETPTQSNSDIDDLSKQLTEIAQQIEKLKIKLQNNQTKINTQYSETTRELATLKSKIQNSITISEQEKMNRDLKQKKIELIDLEIKDIQEVLSYNKGASELITKAKRISNDDPTAVQKYNDQLDNLNKSIQENQTTKASKENERKALVNQ
jgi:S1-C subfamily serine protease